MKALLPSAVRGKIQGSRSLRKTKLLNIRSVQFHKNFGFQKTPTRSTGAASSPMFSSLTSRAVRENERDGTCMNIGLFPINNPIFLAEN
jgi:hypothetical protein